MRIGSLPLRYMWRSINTSVPRAFDARRSVSTYQGDLLSGAMLFNKKFTAQWAADGYRCVCACVYVVVSPRRFCLQCLLCQRPRCTAGCCIPLAPAHTALAYECHLCSHTHRCGLSVPARDYLSSGADLVETGREVLSRILLRDDDSAGTPSAGGAGGCVPCTALIAVVFFGSGGGGGLVMSPVAPGGYVFGCLPYIVLRCVCWGVEPGRFTGDAGAGLGAGRREPSDSWSAPKSRGGGGTAGAGAGAGAGGYEDASPVGS
jgi:hypothetical protein